MRDEEWVQEMTSCPQEELQPGSPWIRRPKWGTWTAACATDTHYILLLFHKTTLEYSGETRGFSVQKTVFYS